ncbi:MAG: Excinuclease subunit [Bacteroidota bacterium]|jgi:excinuclease ABC subunit C
MTVEEFKIFQPQLPNQPGVYRYVNAENVILYVGKAKNLFNRVSSYFVSLNDKPSRLQLMIRQAVRIEFTIVNTENDALLLENTLIKEHQPKYNIQLKDGKSYPWICIKKEPFPKVFSTRKIIKDGSEYFGPYPSGTAVYAVLEVAKQLFPFRTCSLNLAKKNIEQKKYKVCLEYHIGNCKGPCIGAQTEDEYDDFIRQFKNIIKGQTAVVFDFFKQELEQQVEKLEFEKADWTKKKMDALKTFKERSTVVNPYITNVDVFSMVQEQNTAFVNYMKVVNGAINQSYSIELKQQLDETKEELLEYAVEYLRTKFESTSPEIIVPFELEGFKGKIEITVPIIGDKKHLLNLSEKNVIYFRDKSLSANPDNTMKTEDFSVLKEMQKDFRLADVPFHIECFDNSNFQGDFAVSAMVVFKNGKPSKKDYRHFNIKTVVGPDDFASMEEVIERRYSRLIAEAGELPQLILIDGGKGQLSAAYGVLKKLDLVGKVGLASIAKKLEEIYVPNDSIPLHVSKKSASLKLLQYLRDEAHRFGITHHRNKRDKATLMPQLEKIKGIGQSTNTKLLKHFRSVEKIRQASYDEVAAIVGFQKAQLVKNYFESEKTD